MKVAIKTLDGKQFDVEVEAGMLVSQVKEVIQAASPDQSFTVKFWSFFHSTLEYFPRQKASTWASLNSLVNHLMP